MKLHINYMGRITSAVTVTNTDQNSVRTAVAEKLYLNPKMIDVSSGWPNDFSKMEEGSIINVTESPMGTRHRVAQRLIPRHRSSVVALMVGLAAEHSLTK